MKKILATIIFSSFFLAGGYAQDLKKASVPKVVKEAFLAKYPECTKFKVSWEKEKTNYEGNWGGKSGEDNTVLFTPKGIFVEQVKAIAIKELPEKALAYIKKNKAKIIEAGLVTDAKGTVSYEAEMRGGKELVFDNEGNFLRKA